MSRHSGSVRLEPDSCDGPPKGGHYLTPSSGSCTWACGDAVVSVVMKFGGTSVADPDAINRLIGIVRQQQAKTKSAPLVVVSALAGVTDKLVALVQLTEDGASAKAAAEVNALLERHLSVAAAVTEREPRERAG